MGTPIDKDTVASLWQRVLLLPMFAGLVLALPFLAEPRGGDTWEMSWGIGIALLWCWLLGLAPAALSFREMARRGSWTVPGSAKHPWLMAPLYVALAMPLAALLWLFVITPLAWVYGLLFGA